MDTLGGKESRLMLLGGLFAARSFVVETKSRVFGDVTCSPAYQRGPMSNGDVIMRSFQGSCICKFSCFSCIYLYLTSPYSHAAEIMQSFDGLPPSCIGDFTTLG